MKDVCANAVDGVARNAAHPNTFEIPTEAEKRAVTPGDHVKICVGRERFWVEVARHEDDLFEGRVDNDLALTAEHGLACNDMVRFAGKHILAVLSQRALMNVPEVGGHFNQPHADTHMSDYLRLQEAVMHAKAGDASRHLIETDILPELATACRQ